MREGLGNCVAKIMAIDLVCGMADEMNTFDIMKTVEIARLAYLMEGTVPRIDTFAILSVGGSKPESDEAYTGSYRWTQRGMAKVKINEYFSAINEQ